MWTYIIPFFIYWLIFFVVCYIIVDYAQKYLYDEVTKLAGLKVALGTMGLAVLSTWMYSSGRLGRWQITQGPMGFDTMLTSNQAMTLLLGLVWFGVFTLVFQFHPQHALFLSIPTMVMVVGLAGMGAESITKPKPVAAVEPRKPNTPVRKPGFGVAPKAEPTTTPGDQPAAGK